MEEVGVDFRNMEMRSQKGSHEAGNAVVKQERMEIFLA
jgi:hypothetical protein